MPAFLYALPSRLNKESIKGSLKDNRLHMMNINKMLKALTLCSYMVLTAACADPAPATPLASEDPPSIQSAAFTSSTTALLTQSPPIAMTVSSTLSATYHYETAIGTTDGGIDVAGWTSAGTTSPIYASSTSLANNTTYYASARIVDSNSNVISTMSAGNWMHTPYLVSKLVATDSASFSYVHLDVDWTRKIAYLASRQAGKCLTAIDFSDEANPTVLKVIGSATSPATGGSTCLGVRLYNNGTRLVLGVLGANLIEVWDLGANPAALNWTKLSSVTVAGPKRVDVEEVSPTLTRVYAAKTGGITSLDITEPAGTMVATGTYTYTPGGTMNDVTYLGSHLLTASDANAAPIHDVAISTLTLNGTFSTAAAAFTMPWFWSATRSLDGTLAYLGGVGGGFLQLSSGTMALVSKHAAVAPPVRDSTFSIEGGQPVLYTIKNSRQLYRWNLASVSVPVLTHSTTVNDAVSGGYGIRVNAATMRGIVITNGGSFTVIRTDQLDAASATEISTHALY